jgi:hypothetical protein
VTLLHERQREFAAAVLNPDSPIPAGVAGPDGKPSVKRFAVYRNNCIAGLVATLEAAYPATCRIVGADFFSTMARIYVPREPPSSPIMLDYGASFPAFIDTFEPAASVPYLSDVARLERAWLEAYHAAEAQPIDVTALCEIDPDLLPRVGLLIHPAVRVVSSSFPVVSLWQMNVAGGVPSALDVDCGGEEALVMRPAAEVEVRTLNPGAAPFIAGLMAGETVSQAAAGPLEHQSGFDLAATLAALLKVGAVVGWSMSQDTPRVDLVSRPCPSRDC